MKSIFSYANEYIRQSDWKELALLKFCLCAIGVLLGLAVSPKQRKAAACTAVGVFIVTYIPLMHKLFQVVSDKRREE